ncbi:hypothetical protein J7K76_07370 [Candidatus Bipolaricaulota bacterium]|nr:hypothetical protein [Candidatus Bipolaricaulota bacterium]
MRRRLNVRPADGKYALLTGTDLPAEEVALAYKGLWRVEAAFRQLKDQLELGPIHHWTEVRVQDQSRGWGRTSGRCFRTWGG